MTPLDLALTYMNSLYGDGDFEALRDILADDLIFEGPLFAFDSAAAYLFEVTEDKISKITLIFDSGPFRQ